MVADTHCKKSASHSHDADRKGICYWCKQKVDLPVPAPVPNHYNEVSELTWSYGYFYDPDFDWPGVA